MIGTEVLFDIKQQNGRTYDYDWVKKTGTIRDKIRRPYESFKDGRNNNLIIDYYVIESENRYYFVECSDITFKIKSNGN